MDRQAPGDGKERACA